MRLPFQPESFAELQARYPQALTPVVDAVAVERGLVPAPSGERAHVFDIDPPGLRLIVSTDRGPDGLTYLHLSASADGALEDAIQRGDMTRQAFCARVIATWQDLAKSTAQPELIGFTMPKGIPHWLLLRKD